MDAEDFVTEANVDLGLIVSEQRVVEIDKVHVGSTYSAF